MENIKRIILGEESLMISCVAIEKDSFYVFWFIYNEDGYNLRKM